jgi:hypothetical protein
MKAEDIRYKVGDVVYAIKGRNRINNDIAVLEQRVEAVLLEVDDDGEITDTSYILTDDLGKYRSTKAKAVFTTIEDAIEYAKDKDE